MNFSGVRRRYCYGDGRHGWRFMSASREFIQIGWHRILVEANPRHWDSAEINSLDATFVGAAICNNPDGVHFLKKPGGDGGVDGIAEFQNQVQLREFHRNIWDALQQQGGEIQNLDYSKVVINETAADSSWGCDSLHND
eukprot:UN15094